MGEIPILMTVKLIYERIQNNNDEKREAGRQKLEDKINEFIKNIDNSSISISQTFVDDGLILSTDVIVAITYRR